MNLFSKLFGSKETPPLKEETNITTLNIGIILGSTRKGRLSPQFGNWVKELADKRGDANNTIIDIAD